MSPARPRARAAWRARACGREASGRAPRPARLRLCAPPPSHRSLRVRGFVLAVSCDAADVRFRGSVFAAGWRNVGDRGHHEPPKKKSRAAARAAAPPGPGLNG
jgi:hypothetical protein